MEEREEEDEVGVVQLGDPAEQGLQGAPADDVETLGRRRGAAARQLALCVEQVVVLPHDGRPGKRLDRALTRVAAHLPPQVGVVRQQPEIVLERVNVHDGRRRQDCDRIDPVAPERADARPELGP